MTNESLPPIYASARHLTGPTPSGRHAVIVAGGSLGDWALPYLAPGSFLIGADRGAWFLLSHGLTLDMALGDFDSVTPEERDIIRLKSGLWMDCDPVRKDLTDTEWALSWALEAHPASVLLLGVTGTRFDHTFANVQLLAKAAELRIPCRIIDAHNEISLLSGADQATLTKGRYEQVSLLPLSGAVTGITLEGFRYPLTDAQLRTGQSLGISNVIEGETAVVRIREGQLLVVQSRD
ncbi:thiamine diphosphokinase [Gorillibacterium sp. sgz5001074]|uniref:thiamine diphosphokinase n=1 Tax=Gorillibacterium sp. sgz5001074 TaxID=3446695 RepID=UPI003F66349B